MYERFVIASITFSISLFGITSNLTVLLSAMRMSSMNSSFGVITKNTAICNLIICLIFMIYMCPIQLKGTEFFIESHYVGLVAMSVYEVFTQSHFLIALNRFCAVFVSGHYERLFCKFGTIIIINVIWNVSIVVCVVLYEVLGCYFSYDDASWALAFPTTEMCTKLTWYSDFTFNTSLIVTTLLIDLITACKAGIKSRMLMNAAGMKMSKQLRHRELNFIRQAFCQGANVFTSQIAYYAIAPLFPDAAVLFFVSSLWPFMHAFEGAIIIASNEEMRTFAFKRGKTAQATMFVASASVN